MDQIPAPAAPDPGGPVRGRPAPSWGGPQTRGPGRPTDECGRRGQTPAPGTHGVAEPVGACGLPGPEKGAVVPGGLAPGPVEVVCHEVDEVQVSVQEGHGAWWGPETLVASGPRRSRVALAGQPPSVPRDPLSGLPGHPGLAWALLSRPQHALGGTSPSPPVPARLPGSPAMTSVRTAVQCPLSPARGRCPVEAPPSFSCTKAATETGLVSSAPPHSEEGGQGSLCPVDRWGHRARERGSDLFKVTRRGGGRARWAGTHWASWAMS